MGETTKIGWTDHTFNPWWGCQRVSPGCEHCYAETFAKRTGNDVWGKTADRRFFGDKHWREPLKWNAEAYVAERPALVFCASMADVFEDREDLVEPRRRLFELIERTPSLRWQLLTKRPQNVLGMVPRSWVPHSFYDKSRFHFVDVAGRWPSNAWIGTTVEDQARAVERLPQLAMIPAPVRFVSAEPLLGPVVLGEWKRHIDWLIIGGESGNGFRPLNLDHARALAAEATGIPVFFKQVGGRTPTAGGDELFPGLTMKEFPDEAGR